MSVDPQKVAGVIAEIARAEIMARYGKLSSGDVRRKSGPNDLVTVVDEATEARLRAALSDIRPDAAFIGEELAAKKPQIVSALAGEGAFWVVDPLDGTRNFVRGVDEFGVIVALVENGETKMGWIYAAPHDEMGIAVKGEGAVFDGAPVTPRAASGKKLVALRSLGWVSPPARQDALRETLKRRFDSRPGYCSAYAYLHLALGDVDMKLSSRIHPWDHLAGALMVTEAGGRVAFLDDEAAYGPSPSVDRLLLAVAPGRDWDAAAEAIRT